MHKLPNHSVSHERRGWTRHFRLAGPPPPPSATAPTLHGRQANNNSNKITFGHQMIAKSYDDVVGTILSETKEKKVLKIEVDKTRRKEKSKRGIPIKVRVGRSQSFHDLSTSTIGSHSGLRCQFVCTHL